MIGIESATTQLLNIYCPTRSQRRKETVRFYASLQKFQPNKEKELILTGDFNCVLDTYWDRCTNGRSNFGPTESKELELLLDKWGLIDAIARVQHNQLDWE
jgi:exonuclease III